MPKTLIYYYVGAYGPTIRIDTLTKTWLEYLKDNVLKLIAGDIKELKIDCMENVVISDMKSLTLKKVGREVRRKIFVQDNNNNINDFIWLQDIEELITLAGLIDGLLDCNQSGHQYLTSEEDGVLITLAYMEYHQTNKSLGVYN